MRIDFHVHVTPPEIIANWERYAQREPYFAKLSNSPINKYAAAEDVIAALDKAQFDRAVIFGFAFRDSGLCRMVNDYVIEKVREFPDRLTGFMSVSPNSRELEKEVDRCYSAGLYGVGELYPDGQGVNIDNERETCTLVNACMERDIPLILHTNEPVGHEYIGKNDIPLKKIERFIENSRGLKVVLAHWGGGLMFYEAFKGFKEKFRNVYYDTAASPFLYDARIYRAAKALGLCDKILFGSDFPLLPQSRYFDDLQASGLSAEDTQLILGGNGGRLLKI